MRKLIIVLAAVACLGVAGCAQKKLTREESIVLDNAASAAMVRQYTGINKERIIAACEQALRSSDTDYDITQHVENGFYAQRRWSIYMIIAYVSGVDNWKITVEEKENENTVEIRSWPGDMISASPLPTTYSGGTENNYYISPSLYKLLFDRMDYFLGLRTDWVTCDNAEKNLHQYEQSSGLDPLCTLANSKDPTKQQTK